MHRVHLAVSGTGEGKVIRWPAFATSVYAPHNDMTMTVEKGDGTRSGFHRENVSFALDNFLRHDRRTSEAHGLCFKSLRESISAAMQKKASFAIRNGDDSQLCLGLTYVDAAFYHHGGARLIPRQQGSYQSSDRRLLTI